jgi:hypothetical protein
MEGEWELIMTALAQLYEADRNAQRTSELVPMWLARYTRQLPLEHHLSRARPDLNIPASTSQLIGTT